MLVPEAMPLLSEPSYGFVLFSGHSSTQSARPVHPSHYKCPQSGVCLEVENPAVWVYPDGLNDDPTHMSEA